MLFSASAAFAPLHAQSHAVCFFERSAGRPNARPPAHLRLCDSAHVAETSFEVALLPLLLSVLVRWVFTEALHGCRLKRDKRETRKAPRNSPIYPLYTLRYAPNRRVIFRIASVFVQTLYNGAFSSNGLPSSWQIIIMTALPWLDGGGIARVCLSI